MEVGNGLQHAPYHHPNPLLPLQQAFFPLLRLPLDAKRLQVVGQQRQLEVISVGTKVEPFSQAHAQQRQNVLVLDGSQHSHRPLQALFVSDCEPFQHAPILLFLPFLFVFVFVVVVVISSVVFSPHTLPVKTI